MTDGTPTRGHDQAPRPRVPLDAAVRESEARFQALAATGTYVVYRMSPDWREMYELSGGGVLADTAEPITDWADTYLLPEDRPALFAAIDAAIQSRSLLELEHRVRRADGSIGWVVSHAAPVTGPDGEIEEWFGVAGDVTGRREAEEALREREGHQRFLLEPSDAPRAEAVADEAADIIERHQAQNALRESEERYRTLFETMGQGYALVELVRDETGRAVDQRYLELNPAFERIFGIPVAQARGRTASELFPDLESWWHDALDRVARSGTAERIEHEMASRGRWYEVWVYPRGGDRLTALYEEITARKVAEEALRESEERQAFLLRLSDALRAVPDAQAIQDQTVRMVAEHLRLDRCYISEVFEEQGYSTVGPEHVRPGHRSMVGTYQLADYPETMRQLSTQPMVIQDSDTDPRFSDAEKAMLALVPQRALLVAALRKGPQAVVWALGCAMATPRRWTESDRLLVEEVAERNWGAAVRARAEAALRESEARFRTLSDAVPQVIWTNDAAGQANHFNERWFEYTGLGYEQSVGQGWQAVVHPEDAPASRERWRQSLATGEAFDTEYRLRDAAGTVTGWFGSATDIGELKQAQAAEREARESVARANAELEQRVAERTRDLAELSELRQELLRQLVTAQEAERARIARDLHDDTGQQVTGLLLGLDRLARSPAGAERETGESIRRLQELAQDVAQKSHRLAVTLRSTTLDDLGLLPAVRSFAEEWRGWSGVPVEVEALGLETRLPPEVETTIYRVVQEALTNVLRHAAPREGHRGATRVSILLQRRGGEVRAVVEDNGPGFDVEAVLNLPPGRRRIGIFGMQERARLAGGTLTIESEPGVGTSVHLRIPLPREGGGDAGAEDRPGGR